MRSTGIIDTCWEKEFSQLGVRNSQTLRKRRMLSHANAFGLGIYDKDFEVVAIADNHAGLHEYACVKVISANEIDDYEYDEIWIASIYYKEIKK